MHVLKLNATLKSYENYINEWVRLKHPMQERYDVILGMVDAGTCDECRIDVTKNAVTTTLRFSKRDDLISFLVNNPVVRLESTAMESSGMSITEE